MDLFSPFFRGRPFFFFLTEEEDDVCENPNGVETGSGGGGDDAPTGFGRMGVDAAENCDNPGGFCCCWGGCMGGFVESETCC